MPRSLFHVALVTAVLAGAGPAALAQDCAASRVAARGGPSLLETTARSRARSAWIKKVRATRRFGRDYAAWLRARAPAYACHRHGKRFYCEASAEPCKLEPIAAR
ncbi:MAG: hypothetical protein JSS20_08285 [Proteobacteria bacterium]|nr:hypothetical protein [Pseudomonadota bacterium]